MRRITLLTLLSTFVLFYCNPAPEETPVSSPIDVAFIVTSDYTTGSYSTIELSNLKTARDLGTGKIHSDACARYFNGYVYVINRQGRDNIQVLDPGANFQTLREISVGTNSNPHDIIVVSKTKAYVTRWGAAALWIIDPSTGTKTGEIDLSSYADADGLPEMDKMYYDAANSRLFVTLQKLDSANWYAPTTRSSVVVISTATDTVSTEIVLQAGGGYPVNPFSHLRFVSKSLWQPATADNHDHLFVACVNDWGFQANTGIVAIDLTDLNCESAFVIQNNDTSFGEINDFVIKTSTLGYAVTADSSSRNKLIRFNTQTGAYLSTLHTNASYSLTRLDLHASGKLFVCDSLTAEPGVRVYDTGDSDKLLEGKPLDVGLPPMDITFVE